MLRSKGHTFCQLREHLPIVNLKGDFPVGEVSGLVIDSREAEEACVFFAVPGAVCDGADYAAAAWEKGAWLVVAEREVYVPAGKCLVVVEDIRDVIGQIATEFSRELLKELTIVGVTGTNGKTTTAHMIHTILSQAGRKSAFIGTTGVTLPDGTLMPLPNTTPDILTLLSIFSEGYAMGIDNFVIEVSSQGVVQRRVKGIPFRVGVFTNLTEEHMETHGTFEKYHEAKLRFFVEAAPDAAKLGKVFIGVVNKDSEYSSSFEEACPGPPFLYGRTLECDVRAMNIQTDVKGVRFDLTSRQCKGKVSLPLGGLHNVYNALAAVTAAIALAIPPSRIIDGLMTLETVPGRLERVGGSGYNVFVDYAHTSDALEKILLCGRKMAESSGGRLICVFGCGGDRDRTKRPRMGKVASRLSDVVFVTSDNPRTEDPHFIISEILAGVDGHAEGVEVEADREKAIARAVDVCLPQDVLIIAGKGHEDYQILGTKKIHFDDREVAAAALERKGS